MIRRILPLVGLSIFCTQFTFSQTKNESVATTWLTNHFKELQTQRSASVLKHETNTSGASGETFRYGQYVNNVPVYGVNLSVHLSPDSEVTFHSGTYKKNVSAINTTPNINEKEAVSLAAKALNIEGTITQMDSKLYVYKDEESTRLVYRITTNSKTLNGYWETLVDAKTSEIISTKDIAHYHHASGDNNEKDKEVEAQGMIFNPDPLSASGNEYGGLYMDNNDETNDALNNARSQVTFTIANSENGVYKLKGKYSEIKEIQNPETGLFEQTSPVFNFSRDEDGFEAVNVYYHIDRNMRYINETLGIPLQSMFNNGIILFDPHAFNGADNSSYGGGILKFGTGGVDDGEDADVIVHELGHGIHEWLIQSSISQKEGLSEGFGDYWAQSYSRGLQKNNSSRSSKSYNNLFKWDGHNEFWSGRVTNYEAVYPEGLTGKVHKDGQIFATALMKIWEVLGKETTDKMVLEGLSMTTSETNQAEAALAIRQAGIDMGLGCNDITTVTDIFNATGYNLPEQQCARLEVADLEVSRLIIYPNPASETIAFKNLSDDQEIAIYNVMGQVVLRKNINASNNTINVSNLSKGMYLVGFKGVSNVMKFIKQ
ncbi:T9SS type A sorting domain-containing protein [Formosa sp. S-31]|uniref:T9SS type A sorting domain-containing protein n=1 Tax=Formosa sp. S-31 TaxID=2790949 RepID=UPI003EB972D4